MKTFSPLITATRSNAIKSFITKASDVLSSPAVLSFLLAISTSFALAQPPSKEWDARFGGSDYDYLVSLQQTADGGYILGGPSESGISGDKTQASRGETDYWIVKTDSNGVKQWDARFGGSSDDYLLSIKQTADGGYILGGNSFSGISGDKTQASQGGYDYWIVKTDANGVKQWDARFGGSSDENFLSLGQTNDGGYILGGYSLSGISGDKTQASQGLSDYWIVKTDGNGVKQWDARFGGSNQDFLHSVEQTAEGGYILGGHSYSGIGGDKTQESWGGGDYWIVKTDANGVKQWDARFGGSSQDFLLSLQQTAEGGYILSGYSDSGISGDKTQASLGGYDYWIIKTDGNGVKQWDARFGGSSDDFLSSVKQTADGGYILGGASYSGISGDKTQESWGGTDYWIVKTDANGVKQWDGRFGGSNDDDLFSLQQTADGGYILGGNSFSGISGDKTQASQGLNDYWIVRAISECSGGLTVYADLDADGYGDAGNTLFASDCMAPSGYVYNNTDCNDNSAAINPGALEIVGDGIDNNCNGIIDEVVSCLLPANLSVVNITGTSAKLKWDAAAAEGYKVRYKVSNTSEWKMGTTDHNAKVISSLLPNTEYTWEVKTYCQITPNVMSDWSEKQYFMTGSARMGDENAATLGVYPNPVSESFMLDLQLGSIEDQSAIIFLLDQFGQIVYSEKVVAGNGELKKEITMPSSAASGWYMVRVVMNDQVIEEKLLYQK